MDKHSQSLLVQFCRGAENLREQAIGATLDAQTSDLRTDALQPSALAFSTAMAAELSRATDCLDCYRGKGHDKKKKRGDQAELWRAEEERLAMLEQEGADGEALITFVTTCADGSLQR